MPWIYYLHLMETKTDRIIALTYVTVLSHVFEMCVLNIQSARNKLGDLNDIMVEKNLDFMVLKNSG